MAFEVDRAEFQAMTRNAVERAEALDVESPPQAPSLAGEACGLDDAGAQSVGNRDSANHEGAGRNMSLAPISELESARSGDTL